MSDQSVVASLEELGESLTGQLLTPGEPEYDTARQVFVAAFDRHPAAIVRPADAADVARAVSFARERGLELAIRGGGHGFAGHGASEGGLVLDMSAMNDIEIDLEAKTAWAQAGAKAGKYTDMAGRHGLATGFGDTGSVGVAGITLGGGIGWLVRKHGLTIDQLLAVEIVTADGELRQVDADSHPDLFWALRGGGGNFGVVTRLKYRLYEVDRIFGGMLVLPATADVVRGLLAFAERAPEELSLIAHIAPVPPMPDVPAEHHGRLAVTVMLVYAGDPAAGERVVAPLRELAPPMLDALGEMAYTDIFGLGGRGPDRATIAVRTGFSDGLDDAAIEAILARLAAPREHMAMAQLRPLGGATARVPADATAFAHRDRKLMVIFGAMGMQPEQMPVLDAWAQDSADALGLPGGGAYVNYLAADGPERIREAYPEDTYDRLAEIKRRYDPDNVFRANQNVAPAEE